MPRFSLKSLLLVTALLAVATATWAAVVGYRDRSDPFDRMRFSAALWSQRAGRGWAPMARDVVRHHLPAGLSRRQVVTLLGKPSVITPDSYEYYLGNWSGYGYHDAFLCIQFDARERVMKANLVY